MGLFGLPWIGIEKEKEWVDLAQKRLTMPLFHT